VALPSYPPRAGRDNRPQVYERVKDIPAQLTLDGVQVELVSVQACCAYAVWLVIKGDGALAERIVWCKTCGLFGLNENGGKGRPRRHYCNKACRKQLSVWTRTRNRRQNESGLKDHGSPVGLREGRCLSNLVSAVTCNERASPLAFKRFRVFP
jgi:hypothetical protein